MVGVTVTAFAMLAAVVPMAEPVAVLDNVVVDDAVWPVTEAASSVWLTLEAATRSPVTLFNVAVIEDVFDTSFKTLTPSVVTGDVSTIPVMLVAAVELCVTAPTELCVTPSAACAVSELATGLVVVSPVVSMVMSVALAGTASPNAHAAAIAAARRTFLIL